MLPFKLLKNIQFSKKSPAEQQLKVLTKLLTKARFTEFGQTYNFDTILNQEKNTLISKYQECVPIFDYNKIYSEWWYKNLEGKFDICWPGKIKYFALSSGTSGAASKYIPITKDLLKSNSKIMVRQLLSLVNYQSVPKTSAARGWLSLSGSTALQKYEDFYAGDLSGISAKKAPFWFAPFKLPGKKIAQERDWNKKLEDIANNAQNWDIGFILGVPSWTILLFEMIIQKYKLKTIHEIWPNFDFYVHGGVFFEPYKKNFEALLGKPISYIETYLASEGFLAYQEKQNYRGMKLVINEHLFFEFVPFNSQNFDEDGNLKNHTNIKLIDDVELDTDYAPLISTNAGTWRYLIGDTIRFINTKDCDIIITGRTKQYLSVVGEHLSIDNLNQAITNASQHFNIYIPEFTVAIEENKPLFCHHWYLASNDHVDAKAVLEYIDHYLKTHNDDYKVERNTALKNMKLDVFPETVFMSFLQHNNKIGSQQKFPRVMKGINADKWNAFILTHKPSASGIIV